MNFVKYYEKNVLEYVKKAGMVHSDILDIFLSFVKKKGLVLDLGCGPGQDTNYFVSKGFRTIGIDLSVNMIKYAVKNHKGAFAVCDMNKIAGTDTFDAVWSASALFTHIKKNNRIKIIKNIHNLLVEGGVLGVVVRERTRKIPGFYSYTEGDVVSELELCSYSFLTSKHFKQGETSWILIIVQKK